ncbi:hypothetical protein BDV93DRAFT_159258 [Ceratobasidium sp. AG-I]|nr:hypothetical protein BDV93DRAFT_159258 [Ceratobasidium sp. AG-I]
MMEDVEFEPEAAVDTVKAVYKECWEDFYTWYCTGLVNTLDLGASPLVDLQGREELEDRMPSEKESLVLSSEASSRLTYVDDDALDLDDELVQPELQQVKSMNMVLKVKTVPPYTSYQSIRHSVYLRGDLWEDKATGSEVRLAPKVIGDQEDVPNLEELRRDAKRVEKRQIVNIETEENMARNQESMPFIPLDIPVGSAYREEYAQAFHDIEEWQDSDVHWDNNGVLTRLLVLTE